MWYNTVIGKGAEVILLDYDQLKRKMRNLKKVEERIRFNNVNSNNRKHFVWDQFFSTRLENDTTVKYSLYMLIHMDKQHFKEVIEEYFYSVYFQKYKENGITIKDIYDPELLSALNLLPGSSIGDIKTRFRELAKKFHPDHGGDENKMIEILEAYHKLIN